MVGLRVRVRFRHGSGDVDAPFGVGEAAFLLRPHRGRQIDVRVVGGLDILVGILHDAEVELLHGLADARRVGHGGHGIGGDDPQRLDLAGFDGGKDVGLEEPPLGGEEFGIDIPELAHFLAVGRVLELPIARQARTGGPFPRAHGIALAGDGKAGAAGPADVAGDEVQVIDGADTIGAVGGLVDAHRPDGHRRASLAVEPGNGADGVLVDAADARGGGGVVLLHRCGEVLEALGVSTNVGLVRKPFAQDDVAQAVQQHEVRARRDG